MIKQIVNKFDVPQGKIGINELTDSMIIVGRYEFLSSVHFMRLTRNGYRDYQWKAVNTSEQWSSHYATITDAVKFVLNERLIPKLYAMTEVKELGEFLTKDGNIDLQSSDLKRGTKVKLISTENTGFTFFDVGDILTFKHMADDDMTVCEDSDALTQNIRLADLELYKEPQCGDKVILLSGHDNRWYGGKELTFRGQTWNDHIMLEDEDGHRDTTDMSNIKLAS